LSRYFNEKNCTFANYLLNFKANKMAKRIIHTDNAPKAIGPYSQAIEANGMLFISGQIPVNPATGTIPEGIEAQTQQVMKNIEAILKEAGYSFKDVIKSTCLLSDIANFKAMNEVYAQYYKEDCPARAAFAVKDLPMGVLVEIETIAAK
jgi:2-iminobutanoate/2-iminopropanoate deaminase